MDKKWAAYWQQNNELEGRREWIIWVDGDPMLFRTKRECYVWIRKAFGYIAKRPDLRREPHCWRMPVPVRVRLVVA